MRGKDVELVDVSMRFGDFTAVQSTNARINAGEFFSILGPSGCGKTTLLRMISGFLRPTTGEILIGGEPTAGIGPNRRPTALIFQNLALFPLMTVWENVAFGLECRGVAKAARQGARGRAARARGADRPGPQEADRAVRRAAPAGRGGPRARGRAGRAAARRAALGARPQAPPAHAHRAAPDPEAGRHHLHLHHPRSGRGADHVGPHRRDVARRDRAGRHAGPALRRAAIVLRRDLRRREQRAARPGRPGRERAAAGRHPARPGPGGQFGRPRRRRRGDGVRPAGAGAGRRPRRGREPPRGAHRAARARRAVRPPRDRHAGRADLPRPSDQSGRRRPIMRSASG